MSDQLIGEPDTVEDAKVRIIYSVEVDGEVVYVERFDADELAKQKEEDLIKGWICRMKCLLCCRKKSGFVACLARCVVDGNCCDSGYRNCSRVC